MHFEVLVLPHACTRPPVRSLYYCMKYMYIDILPLTHRIEEKKLSKAKKEESGNLYIREKENIHFLLFYVILNVRSCVCAWMHV